jgi:hypothetical protein
VFAAYLAHNQESRFIHCPGRYLQQLRIVPKSLRLLKIDSVLQLVPAAFRRIVLKEIRYVNCRYAAVRTSEKYRLRDP